MRELQDAGRIRIGVPTDAPPLGYVGPGGEPLGFSVALGRMVAQALGVAPEFRPYPSERLEGLVAIGGADVAFPLAPITEDVVRRQSASDPYLVSHQRLLVRQASDIEDVDDLSGSSACESLDPNTGVPLEALDPTIEVTVDGLQRCGDRLARGRAEAVTAEDFLLAHLRSDLQRSGSATRLTGDSLNTVGYGARVIQKSGFAQFVSDVFAAAKQDGRWARAYERWMDDPAGRPPSMTVWEAAALWPRAE